MTDKKQITFIEDVVVKDHNKAVIFSAGVGEVKELSMASADRWIKRNMAIEGKVDLNEQPAETTDEDSDEPAKSPTPKKKAAPKKKA